MKWLSSIKSHDPLVMWSYEIMWQTETSHLHHHNAYDHQTCLWPLNIAEWRLTLKGTYPQSHMTSKLCGLARQCDKSKILYLHYQKIFHYYTWYKMKSSYSSSHMISQCVVWVRVQLVTYHERLQVKPHGPSRSSNP